MATPITLVDFEKMEDGYYHSTYATYLSRLFKKQYIKILFRSKNPYYLWSDIKLSWNKYTSENHLYLEDLVGDEVEQNIGIGLLSVKNFSKEDEMTITKLPNNWNSLLLKAVDKCTQYQKEYHN